MTTTRKTTTRTTARLALGLAALASVGVTMVPTDAEAGWRGRRNWAIGAGVIGGLAAGTLIAGAAHAHSPYYAAPAYAPDCYFTKQRRVTWDGYVVLRTVRVCD